MRVNCLKAQSHCEEAVYFLSLSHQKLLVLIWSSSEGWKAESTLEPPSGFEQGTPGFGIQILNQWLRPLKASVRLLEGTIHLVHMFWKTNISYAWYASYLLIQTRTCAYHRVRGKSLLVSFAYALNDLQHLLWHYRMVWKTLDLNFRWMQRCI